MFDLKALDDVVIPFDEFGTDNRVLNIIQPVAGIQVAGQKDRHRVDESRTPALSVAQIRQTIDLAKYVEHHCIAIDGKGCFPLELLGPRDHELHLSLQFVPLDISLDSYF